MVRVTCASEHISKHRSIYNILYIQCTTREHSEKEIGGGYIMRGKNWNIGSHLVATVEKKIGWNNILSENHSSLSFYSS